MVLRGKQRIKIRLGNIDAPEIDQVFGKQSRDALQEMVGRKEVLVESLAIDQYGRVVGLISVKGHNINQEQVKWGMAWASVGWREKGQPASGPTGAPKSDGNPDDMAFLRNSAERTYTNLQHEAQQARRGLWSQPEPQRPWQWRRQHPLPKLTAQGNSRNVSVKCGEKSRCSQMESCDEARFYFSHCGLKILDGDRDGSPCERLCGGD